eukprot:SAG31_NODE_53_length_30139_cov_31.002197_5_plen_199_part_00
MRGFASPNNQETFSFSMRTDRAASRRTSHRNSIVAEPSAATICVSAALDMLLLLLLLLLFFLGGGAGRRREGGNSKRACVRAGVRELGAGSGTWISEATDSNVHGTGVGTFWARTAARTSRSVGARMLFAQRTEGGGGSTGLGVADGASGCCSASGQVSRGAQGCMPREGWRLQPYALHGPAEQAGPELKHSTKFSHR